MTIPVGICLEALLIPPRFVVVSVASMFYFFYFCLVFYDHKPHRWCYGYHANLEGAL
jgi:hypothetical protein